MLTLEKRVLINWSKVLQIMASRGNLIFIQILFLSLSAGVMFLTVLACTEQGSVMLQTLLAFRAEGSWETVCPPYCLEVSHTSCSSTGEEVHIEPYCNCCFLEEAIPMGGNCTLHLTDGSQFLCYWSNGNLCASCPFCTWLTLLHVNMPIADFVQGSLFNIEIDSVYS